jgi:hypothetical protein
VGGKPNYLCDPSNEIDVTAWGAWTSALEGEHIPLQFLVDGKTSDGIKTGGFSGVKYKVLSKIKKAVDYVPLFRNINYLEKFDVVLVCHHFYYNREMTQLLKIAKKTFPNKIFLGTTAYNLGRIREYWRDAAWYMDFKEFIDNCTLYINLNRVADEYYRLLTKTPVVYFPQFYPYEYAKKYFIKLQEKENAIFVAGETTRIDNIVSMLIAKRIQEKHRDYVIKVTSMQGMNLKPLQGANYQVIPFVDWRSYIELLGMMKIVLNMDAWWTKGRVPGDAACVGTPCIGINADTQMELFPELTCRDITDVRMAVNLALRLISENDYYEKIQMNAMKKLEEYSYTNSIDRLDRLVKIYKKGKINEWNAVSWENEFK